MVALDSISGPVEHCRLLGIVTFGYETHGARRPKAVSGRIVGVSVWQSVMGV